MDIMNTLLEQATVALFPVLLAVLTLAVRAWTLASNVGAAKAAVVEALQRAAAVAADELVNGKARDAVEAAKGMAAYVQKGLPDALATLKPQPGALEQMAVATLLQLMQARQDARDARAAI